MDAQIKDFNRLEVEDIDREIYYQEMLGCTVKTDEGGTCATVNCPNGSSRICQNPNVKLDETSEVGCGHPECEEC